MVSALDRRVSTEESSIITKLTAGRRTGIAAMACVLALGVGTGVTASAASEKQRPDGRRDANSALLPPTTNRTDIGLNVGLATSARVSKAKINFSVRGPVAFTYPFASSGFFGSSDSPIKSERLVEPSRLPARPDPACDYYVSGAVVPAWAVDIDDSTKTFRSVGYLIRQRLSLLAFGAVPVTATVTVRQVVRNGKLEPLTLQYPGPDSFRSVPKGDPQGYFGRRGCDAQWEQEVSPATRLSGRANLTVSDVAVDGRAVDVGRNCRSASPLQLNLMATDEAHGGTGYDLYTGGTLRQVLDRRTTRSGNPTALFPGSTNLTIPPFVGCRSAVGEDVSRLVTSLVSGPGNTIAVVQGFVFQDNATSTDHPTLCVEEGARKVCPQMPDPVLPPVPGR